MVMTIGNSFAYNNCNNCAVQNTQAVKKPSNPTTEHRNISELRAYHQPVINFKGKGVELEKLPTELKEAIDNMVIDFEIPSGAYGFEKKPFRGTIKEYLETCFTGSPEEKHTSSLHATTKEGAQSILKEGFDINRCSRSLSGPGIYFAKDLTRIKQVGNGEEILEASISGVCRSINGYYYRAIGDNDDLEEEVEATIKKSGLNLNAKKTLDNYVLQVLQDDFGLDMVYGRDLVVINPKCISGIGRSSLSDIKITGSGHDAHVVESKPGTNRGYNGGVGYSSGRSPSATGGMGRDHVGDDVKYWNY